MLDSAAASSSRRRACVVRYLTQVLTQGGSDEGALAALLLHDGGAAADALEWYLYGDELGAASPELLRLSEPPSLAVFQRECLTRNWPAAFPFDATEPLARSCAAWVENGQACWPSLLKRFPAEASVAATDCATAERLHLSLADFIEAHADPECSLYLRDLHLVAAARPGADAFTAPRLFEDWLGECHDAGLPGAPDLRFVYCGRAGTGTATHVDILDTSSWSWSLTGRKRWQMWAPAHAHLLLDRWGGAPARWPRDASPALWPRAAAAPCLEFISHPGEVVFVPSGWWHSVRNEDDALSVSCNWLNASNALHCSRVAAGDEAEAQRLCDSFYFIAGRRCGVAHAEARSCLRECLQLLGRVPAAWRKGEEAWRAWLEAL